MSDTSADHFENSTLFGYKALAIVSGLSATARRVGGAILDHYNRKTGRCDPSADRIARLLEIHPVSVRKATAELANYDPPLISKSSHAGRSNCAKYTPNFEAFRKIVVDWDASMRTGQASENIAKPLRRTKPNGSLKDSETAIQTLLKNPSKKPLEKAASQTSAARDATKQKSLLLPIDGGKSPSHSSAARNSAEKRLHSDAMNALGKDGYGMWAGQIHDQTYETAVAAEIAQRGSGLLTALDSLHTVQPKKASANV